jgi:hypothetical protein
VGRAPGQVGPGSNVAAGPVPAIQPERLRALGVVTVTATGTPARLKENRQHSRPSGQRLASAPLLQHSRYFRQHQIMVRIARLDAEVLKRIRRSFMTLSSLSPTVSFALTARHGVRPPKEACRRMQPNRPHCYRVGRNSRSAPAEAAIACPRTFSSVEQRKHFGLLRLTTTGLGRPLRTLTSFLSKSDRTGRPFR